MSIFLFLTLSMFSVCAGASSAGHDVAESSSTDGHADESHGSQKTNVEKDKKTTNPDFHYAKEDFIQTNGNLLELKEKKVFQVSKNHTYTYKPTLFRILDPSEPTYQIVEGEFFIEVHHPITFSTMNGTVVLKRGQFVLKRSSTVVSVSSISKDVRGMAQDLTTKKIQQFIPGTTVVLTPPHIKKEFIPAIPMPFEKLPIIRQRLEAMKLGEDPRRLVIDLTRLWLAASKWVARTQQAVVSRQIATAEENERAAQLAHENEAKERLYFRKLYEKNNHLDLE